MPGVNRYHYPPRPPYWVARFDDGVKTHKKSFSTAEFGEAGAFERAVAHREHLLAEYAQGFALKSDAARKIAAELNAEPPPTNQRATSNVIAKNLASQTSFHRHKIGLTDLTRSESASMSTRILTAQTPLGEELKFQSLSGREELGRLFEFRVSLLSKSQSITANALL
ncbi:MAG: hypothetical protein ACRCWJ_16580, partial [Casimicrobium sp.]